MELLTSPETDKLDAAMAAVQAEMPAAPKNAKNPHIGNRYADLGSIWEVARPVLAAHKVSVTQWPTTGPDAERVYLTTRLAVDGQWLTATASMPVPPGNRGTNPAQSYGSGLTYLRRYALGAVLGIVTEEDDDGHGVGGGSSVRNVKRQPQQQQQPPADKPAAATIELTDGEKTFVAAFKTGLNMTEAVEDLDDFMKKNMDQLNLLRPEVRQPLINAANKRRVIFEKGEAAKNAA